MPPYSRALVPIYLRRSPASRPLQIGSSVMLRFSGTTYLLTAAHVSDYHTRGKLCIPGPTGLSEFDGSIGSNILSPGRTRDDDMLDMSVLVPSVHALSVLPAEFAPTKLKNIDVAGNTTPGDFCMVAGFPTSRRYSKHESGTLICSPLHFVGLAVENSAYARHGCNPEQNILIEYHLAEAIFPEGDRANPPKPRGMSGGAIFRIGRDGKGNPDSSSAVLIGVMHKFKERDNLFIGTKVHELLTIVVQRPPVSARRSEA